MFDLDSITHVTLGAAAIVTAIVQAFKMANWVKEGYAPLISIAVGIGVAMLMVPDFINSIASTLLTGITIGLSASGLYSGVKKTAHVVSLQRARQNK